MTAWVLPDHIADVLPAQARHVEDLRRKLLDTAQGYGYELVIPPMLEHLDSLLTGTGEALDLQTFKLVDQLSGRSLGLRADTTPQAARIDAHLLNHKGFSRLTYCGPVLHTRPDKARSSREPLQFGCELFGAEGLAADAEIIGLAIDCLKSVGFTDLVVDLADAGIVRAQLAGVMAAPETLRGIHEALSRKDRSALQSLTQGFRPEVQAAVLALTQLYGGAEVLFEAKNALLSSTSLDCSLSNLKSVADAVAPHAKVAFDLADARGLGYYSGVRFAIYSRSAQAAAPLARGGRYDEVGAVFGRNRAAVGFSLDLKDLATATQLPEAKAAIRAPWQAANPELDAAIARLRSRGETVLRLPEGMAAEAQEFHCDRELFEANGQWALRAV